ncbi:zinc carboxypeptidase family protein [Burkholderia lata]|uniref:Zinc carboxypeptidase family protein n=1 Tax=Burkholderia lata (strain ATCC 17760 / DSM 23089 / LMG 22485 / NCIMB 9086 / R18194 / 383) TaxID=482957 RepID=A0A6P2ULY2_BURL3|nr:hypothetical protein [Burkholderia lata]VWC70228.1 zinc carboxypeptidase family protein [Burkholderia lata]
MKKAPSVSGGAWGGFDTLTYDARPPPGPPMAVVVVVVVVTKSAFMERNLDNMLSEVNTSSLEGLVQVRCGELRPDWESGGHAVHVVVNVNPDGVRLGSLRTNARGANLNRCWDREYPDAPETAAVRRAFDEDLLRRSPVFQTVRGYSVDRPDHPSPKKCIPWTGLHQLALPGGRLALDQLIP